MATTTIPWGDGSGDSIYLTYSSASGDQTVQVSSDANTGNARTKIVTFTSGVGNITQQLTVSQEQGGPREYTITKNPSSIDSVNTIVSSWASGYGYSRAYTSVSSTTEARANMVYGSRAETFVYWKFDLSSIPDNATIVSIELKAKARRSAGAAAVIADTHFVVCNGTTPVGNTTTITGSTITTYTLDAGTGWTGATIKNLSILQYGKRGTNNINNTYFLGLYGATLTIKYIA